MVVFTGDTGPGDAVVKLAMGADVLLVAEVEASSDELRGFIDQMAAQNHWSPVRKPVCAHMEKEHLTVDSLRRTCLKSPGTIGSLLSL